MKSPYTEPAEHYKIRVPHEDEHTVARTGVRMEKLRVQEWVRSTCLAALRAPAIGSEVARTLSRIVTLFVNLYKTTSGHDELAIQSKQHGITTIGSAIVCQQTVYNKILGNRDRAHLDHDSCRIDNDGIGDSDNVLGVRIYRV